MYVSQIYPGPGMFIHRTPPQRCSSSSSSSSSSISAHSGIHGYPAVHREERRVGFLTQVIREWIMGVMLRIT